jgi:hypothetical protein
MGQRNPKIPKTSGVTVTGSEPSRRIFLEGITVCFFVLCNRDWFNKVPGPVTNLGIACIPTALTLTLAMPTYP